MMQSDALGFLRLLETRGARIVSRLMGTLKLIYKKVAAEGVP